MTNYNKILFVTSSFPRWLGDSSGVFILKLAQDLRTLGWTVDVLTPHTPGSKRIEVIAGIKIYRFRYWWPETGENLCSQGSTLVNLRHNPIEIIKVFPLVCMEWWSLFFLLLKGKYSLLHSHWILPQGFNGICSAGILGIPHVLTVHGSDIFALQGKLLNKIKLFSLLHADGVTVNSSFTKEAVLQLASNLENLYLIPMGVAEPEMTNDKDKEFLCRKYRCGNGALLVFVGRLVEEKGLRDLLEAIFLLKKDFPDIHLMVVGDGQERKGYEALVKKLKINKNISFVGQVDPKKVFAYYAAADIFIGPSKQANDGTTESQGLVFIEAMMANTPVVATSVGGIIDAVIHEKTGLLVPENSPPAIAKAVKRLIMDQILVEKLKAGGYQMVVDKFSCQKSASAFSDLYQKIIAKE